jgi:spore germination protein YaaH/putative cell wall-binding protein
MHRRRRLTSFTLALAIGVWAVTPASATDPLEALPPSAEPDGPGIHAEMLSQMPPLPADVKDDETSAPGTEIQSQAGVGTIATAGPSGRLPNGLTREVLGYLPYWNLGASELSSMRYDLLSTIAYFGVAARVDGSLARTVNADPTPGWAGWTSSAMSGVISQAHARGVKVVLTVTMMGWSGTGEMSTFLSTAASRQRLIGEIASVLQARGADGVNLDFEPVPASAKDAYTSFVRDVKAGLVAAGVGSFVTVATMAGAASWSTGYDIVGLTQPGAADAIMVMGYDLSWSGSARAGGVAPITNPHILDVNEAMTAHLQYVAPSKIIWGVPYYGRVWPTESDQLNARACTSASVCPSSKVFSPGASYSQTFVGAKSLAAQHGRRWDLVGAVPWVAWYDSANTTWRQAYYDDAVSLGAKYDLVRQRQLAGIGIWALGMDAGTPELWNVITAKFVRRDTRLAGVDRYETSAAISRFGFPSGAQVAYLATGANFPDALSGGVLAARSGGPILLVRRDELPPATAAELARLHPERVVILGGSGVVSDAVAMAAAGYTSLGRADRLAGADRFETAAQVSRAGFPNGAGIAYLVTGSNFPDALAGGVLAARAGGPVLLVTHGEIPAATAAELSRLRPSQILIIGGPGVVSDAVLNAARGYALSGAVGRTYGADRFQTAVAVSVATFGASAASAFVATGTGFPDALSAVPFAARTGGPLLLVQPTSLPAATAAELYRLNPPSVYVLGATGVVSDQVVAAIHDAFR